MTKPEMIFTTKVKQNKWKDIPSRWYVGSNYGKVADELGAICSDCDDGITTVPVFCKNHPYNNHSSYTRYPNHSFWYTVGQSLHPMGKEEEEEE
tara:strand:- start:14313 stop:14594 length:282 start_codon:yes stop_codon:yes gene_type:complete